VPPRAAKRSPLTPAQEAAAISRRKAIYETIYPETKHGAIGGGHDQSRQFGDSEKADRFTAATASATGKPERSIQRAAERGAKLGSDLQAVAHTSLDKGVETWAQILRLRSQPGRTREKIKTTICRFVLRPQMRRLGT
jgi:hypothetical protein